MAEVMRPLVVLKFGSSVLQGRESLPDVVSEIYRIVRTGRCVVAVVSAFAGVTDSLMYEAQQIGCPHDNINAPAYIATGEEAACAILSLACDRSGLCSVALKTAELGILAEGPTDEASPVALVSSALSRALEDNDVVVVPGFVANDFAGRTVLLGRGGSDLTAVFLADVLGAERVRLVKDVDGIYDRDPATAKDALRFDRIDWTGASQVAGKLVQLRALEYAHTKKMVVEVGAIGIDHVTIIGPSAAPPRFHAPPPRLRVALAGCGVVGAGVAARLLHRPGAFELVGVLVRDLKKRRERNLPPASFVSSVAELLSRQPDVVVDALSCSVTSAKLIDAVLQGGIRVVSANKQALAARLRSAAGSSKAEASLLYSAAVGGAAPLLEIIAQARENGAKIVEIDGIFNGTVNYILERLATGVSFSRAIEDAQRAGLTEADPTIDLSGADVAAKIDLLCKAAFDAVPRRENVEIMSLDVHLAALANAQPLKQVAKVRLIEKDLFASVTFGPEKEGSFAGLSGDRNAIRVTAADGRIWRARGRGAGRWPTTESIFADLIDMRAA